MGAQFSPDGSKIVTASYSKTAFLWDAATAKRLLTLSDHEDSVWSAQFSADGTRIVTASSDNTACIWDAATGEPVMRLTGHQGCVWGAQFNADGLLAITASADKTARIWDVSSGKPIAALSGHQDSIRSAQFSRDGLRIVTASDDRTARIWNAVTRKSTVTLSGHEGAVWCAQFSPDGARIITASDDKTARMWDAATGKLIAIFPGHTAKVRSACFSADGARILTASDDRTARVWEILGTAMPAPAWFPDFLRMLAARTLNADGEPADLPVDEWRRHRAAFEGSLATDTTRYGDIARHHLAHGAEKSIRPGMRTTCGEAADSLVVPGAPQADIERAYALHPAHPLIHLAIAAFQKDAARTAFLRNHGLERLPAELPQELTTRAEALRRALG